MTISGNAPSNPPAGRQFQSLLVSLGVAQPHGLPVAKLAALSGVSRETWRRCANEGDLPVRKLDFIPAMAAALRQCGCRITDEQLQEAFFADLEARHTKIPTFRGSALRPGASPADQMVSVIRGLTDEAEQDEFLRHVAAILTPDERMRLIRGMANPAVEVAQEETSRDDSSDGDGDDDGSTSG